MAGCCRSIKKRLKNFILTDMLFYNIGIFFYTLFIRFASLFNPKAKLWVNGRKGIFDRIEKTLRDKNISGDAYWFHCASLGEFEQGRPVIEALKKQDSSVKIILTFFSPSGYEIRKDYSFADAVFYLPPDFKSNAEKFISMIKPKAAVFVKYEFWLNYLLTLHQKNIPAYLISAVFRPRQQFFKWYGKIFLNTLKDYKKIFVQDDASLRLLHSHGITTAETGGDTRFDRVFEIAENKKELGTIESFCGNKPVIVAGSSWPKDEAILAETFKVLHRKIPHLKMIIAPHEVNKNSIEDVEKTFEGTTVLKYSDLRSDTGSGQVLIIDTIGILSSVYQFAGVSYIGGGFNTGIHNILEPMVYNIPVAFGPHHYKFVEAKETLALHISKEISAADELISFLEKALTDRAYSLHESERIKSYMQSKRGATEKIVSALMA